MAPSFFLVAAFLLSLGLLLLLRLSARRSGATFVAPPPTPAPQAPQAQGNFSLALHPRSPLRVGLLGDSLTGGLMCASGGYGRIFRSYAGPAYEVQHFFIHGLYVTQEDARTHEALPHSVFSVRDGDFLREALAYQADIYLVMLGTCDAIADFYEETAFRASFTALLRLLQAQPSSPEVFVVTSPPLVHLAPKLESQEGALALAGVQASVAEGAGAGLVDAFGAMGGAGADAGLFCDDLHITFAGDMLVAGAVRAALQEALVRQRGWPQFVEG
jgi:lysophospholipase L1-like esterase